MWYHRIFFIIIILLTKHGLLSSYKCDFDSRTSVELITSVVEEEFVVLTRMYHEYAYVNYFVSWYLSLGFTRIYIICTEDENERNYSFAFDEQVKPFIEVFYDETSVHPDLLMDRYFELLRRKNHTWILSVDNDEFLMLPQKYRNVQSFVQDMYFRCNISTIDMFQLHWAIVEYLGPKCPEVDIKTLLNQTIIHHSPLTKSLFRIANAQNVRHSHYPTFFKRHNATIYIDHKIVHNVTVQYEPNHYSYKTAFLLHIRTRGLSDNLMKAMTSHFEEKKLVGKITTLLHFLQHST